MNNFTIFNVITTKFLDQVKFIQNSMFNIYLFGNHVHQSISQPKQQVGAKTFEGEFFTLFQNKLLKPTELLYGLSKSETTRTLLSASFVIFS
jgi:hypothetical protein